VTLSGWTPWLFVLLKHTEFNYNIILYKNCKNISIEHDYNIIPKVIDQKVYNYCYTISFFIILSNLVKSFTSIADF